MLKFVSDTGVQAFMLFVVIFIDCMSLRQLTGSQCGYRPMFDLFFFSIKVLLFSNSFRINSYIFRYLLLFL